MKISNCIYFLIIFCLGFFIISCKRDPVPVDTRDPTNPQDVKDSIWVIQSIEGGGSSASSYDFDYDDSNRISKIYEVYSSFRRLPYTVFYKNGRPSHVIGQTGDLHYKASTVFYMDQITNALKFTTRI